MLIKQWHIFCGKYTTLAAENILSFTILPMHWILQLPMTVPRA